MDNKEKTNRFERHPRLMLFVITLVSAILLDFSAANIYMRIFGYPWSEKEYAMQEIIFKEVQAIEKSYRIKSHVYHHDLAKNISINNSVWGYLTYPICTNSLGFKDRSVRDIPLRSDKYRIVFIGDSMTEGAGFAYDNTFVGLIDMELSKKGIGVFNAAVGSYSPIIYLKKIEYLMKNVGFDFNEVVVFIDISDIQDALSYSLDERGNVVEYNNFDTINSTFDSFKDENINFAGKMVNNAKLFLNNNSILIYYFLKKLLSMLNIENVNYRNNMSIEYHRSLWTIDKTIYDEYGKKGLDECALYMDKLHDLLQSRGKFMTVAVYPWPGQIFYDSLDSAQVLFWKKWCAQHNVSFINFFPYFLTGKTKKEKDEIIEKYYLRNDVHFNENGHKLIANVFLDYYKTRKK